MKILLLIGTGSFIGGVSRYLLSQWIQPKSLNAFPWGTLSVNLIGCLLIGIIFGLAEKGNLSNEVRLFLTTGVLGGFTTFSAFSNETVIMLHNGQSTNAFVYILISVLVGITAPVLGILATRMF